MFQTEALEEDKPNFRLFERQMSTPYYNIQYCNNLQAEKLHYSEHDTKHCSTKYLFQCQISEHAELLGVR